MTDALIKMKRKKNREYNKHRQSYKYLELKRIYKEMLSKAKKKFYRRNISKLRTSNPRLFYSHVKSVTGSGCRLALAPAKYFTQHISTCWHRKFTQ